MYNDLGFTRTKCSCRECTINCEHMPGMLIPDDVSGMMQVLGYATDQAAQFALDNLLASPGAIVAQRTDEGIIQRRIRTLVPGRQPNGRCKFLKGGYCTIHEAAPYGCAFFDAHQTSAQSDHRSVAALRVIDADHRAEGIYSLLWYGLHGLGHVAPGPEDIRPTMKTAAKAEGIIP